MLQSISNKQHKIYAAIIGISVSIICLFEMVGCSCERAGDDSSSGVLAATGSSQGNLSDEGSKSGKSDMVGTSNTQVKGEAKEVNREANTYDYTGWGITATMPDIYFLIPQQWNHDIFDVQDKDLSFYSIFSDAKQNGTEILFRSNCQGITSVKDTVMQQVNKIVSEGGSVEYGSLTVPNMTDAYYYKRVFSNSDDKNMDDWDIQIFFSDGTTNNPQYYSLSLRVNSQTNGVDGGISEENFWGMANSYYLGGPSATPQDYYHKLTGQAYDFL